MNDYRLENLERITFNPQIMAGQATACVARPVSRDAYPRILNCEFSSQW